MHRYLKESGYQNIVRTPAYLFAEGQIPVALVAHADTVFKEEKGEKPVYYDREQGICWSPKGLGADDRAGIYAIIKLIKMGLRPHVIVTTDEEMGCVGAVKMVGKHGECPFKDLRFIIQLDRRGTDDCVFYDCENPEFTEFIETYGFKFAYGSLSDISVIAPAWKIAAVNLSIGYENEHSAVETLNIPAMCHTIERVATILHDVENNLDDIPVYEYIEAPYMWENWGSGYTQGWSGTSHAYNYDTGYSYFQTCSLCNGRFDDTELTTLYVKTPPKSKENKSSFSVSTMRVCTNCFGSSSTGVHWCKDCYRGWVLEDDEEDMKAAKKGADWTCPFCTPSKRTESSEEKD